MFARNEFLTPVWLLTFFTAFGCGGGADVVVDHASAAQLADFAWTPPTGICGPDELQCGSDCVVPDPYQSMDAICWGGSVFQWCFSDYEGPFYACPLGKVDGGGTRYACTYVNNDPLNCGACGVVCPGGKTCSSGQCW